MAKQLIARGSDGLVSIHNEGANYDNPLSNLGNIYFHSALDYLYVVQVVNATPWLHETNGVFASLIAIHAHNLGRVPLVMAKRMDTGQTLQGTMLIDNYDAGWFRRVTLCADATYVYLHWAGDMPGTVGGVSLPLQIYVIGNPSL